MKKSLLEIYNSRPWDVKFQGSNDKNVIHSYIPIYAELFAKYRDTECRVLEVGIFAGVSLRMWEEYFHLGKVCGIDVNDCPYGADLRPMIAEGTHDIRLLDASNPAEVARLFPPGEMFDVIIEDASHMLEHQLAIYANFKDRLNPGGIYVIEDVADIDAHRALFEGIDLSREVEIIDLRPVKHRFDDVLVVIRCRQSSMT